MEINEIIKKWFDISKGDNIDTKDDFFKFVAVWLAFNALYSSKFYNITGDKEQVKRFANLPAIKERHKVLLKDDFTYMESLKMIKSKGVRNMQVDYKWEINDSLSIKSTLLSIYQIRCNLFHGGKTPENLRDINLVKNGYIIISKLIEPMITNYKSQY